MPNKVICFGSKTCAPCKQLKPELEFQATRFGFELEHVEMSLENQAIFGKYNVRSVPTVVCVDKSEQEVGRFIGGQTPSAIEAAIVEWGFVAK